MNLLLDTQAFLWFESGDYRLSVVAKQAITSQDNIMFISIASLWEIAIKYSIGKLELHIEFNELTSLQGYFHLPVSKEHLEIITELPFHHRDPFDRLLIAQSIHENFSIISADANFDLYGVKRIW